MFEHATDGMLFAAADGRITAANPAACALLDMTAEEICGLAYDGLIDQEDPRWQLAVAERDRTGSSVGVARLRRGDGRYVELETTAGACTTSTARSDSSASCATSPAAWRSSARWRS